jgi:hypothetical protein
VAVAPPPPQPTLDEIKAQRALELLAYFLEGTFDTIEQPAGYGGDSTPVRLRIARIWAHRDGEYWFYAEYASPTDDSRVIRRRIMRGARVGTSLYTYDYAVPGDAKAAVGEWRKHAPFASVDPSSLAPLPGCRTLWIVQHDALMAGGTEGNGCRGDGPEGTHEHVDWYLGSNFTRHWIQQLDPSGRQVAGLSGPSEFRKVAQNPR